MRNTIKPADKATDLSFDRTVTVDSGGSGQHLRKQLVGYDSEMDAMLIKSKTTGSIAYLNNNASAEIFLRSNSKNRSHAES